MTGTTSGSRLILPRYLQEDAALRPPVAFPDYKSTRTRAPLHAPVDLPQRLTEVTGPLLGEGRVTPEDADLTRQHEAEPQGQRIIVHGRVLDSDGRPVPHTLVEIWQVDNNGAYLHKGSANHDARDKNFQGFGRFLTGSTGEYYFRTIKPVPYPGRTPHIHFAIKVKGRDKFTTQCYVKGEPGNERDGVLRGVTDPRERNAIIIDFSPVPSSRIGELAARFDIVLGFTPGEPPKGVRV